MMMGRGTNIVTVFPEEGWIVRRDTVMIAILNAVVIGLDQLGSLGKETVGEVASLCLLLTFLR